MVEPRQNRAVAGRLSFPALSSSLRFLVAGLEPRNSGVFFLLKHWWRRLRAAPLIDEKLWRAAVRRVRLLDGIDSGTRALLRAMTAEFLRDKHIIGVRGLDLSAERRVIVAILCCLPMLAAGRSAWRGWHDVVLYPGTFRVRRHEHDEDEEVVTEWDDELDGEAWSHGPIILSWAAIEEDLGDPFAGSNVVAHEIAHKLDLLDGVLDGTPPLAASALVRWRAAMQPAYDALVAAFERDEETVIDPYAAESPDEFFAVVSEYYFSAPDLLREQVPAVHAALRDYYRIEITTSGNL